jgi:hypothetical protein
MAWCTVAGARGTGVRAERRNGNKATCAGGAGICGDRKLIADYRRDRQLYRRRVRRLHRLHDSKKVVEVYDYVDSSIPMLARMFEKRLRGYKALGYSIHSEGAALAATDL